MARLVHGLLLLTFLTTPSVRAQAQSDRERQQLRAQQEKHARLQKSFEEEIEKIVKWCSDRGMVDAAKRTRTENSLPDPTVLSLTALPRAVRVPIPAGAIDDERLWHGKLLTIRSKHAKEIYRLSRTVLRLGFPTYAMQLVREVLHHDPDHKYARRILGFEKFTDRARSDEPDYRGEWVTPFERRMRGTSPKHVWSEDFGWVKATELDKYKQGQRPWNRSWITAAKESEIRRDFANAWEIKTEHFIVKTDHSFESGLEIAKRLERYHTFFHRAFATFFESPEQLAKRFSDVANQRGRLAPPKQMEVHYYKNKGEYVDRLIDKIPQIAMTNGLYYEPDQTCYFFHEPGREGFGTLYHEATHQFLDLPTLAHRRNAANQRALKLGRRARRWVIGEKRNFWILEGIACYMESFRLTEGGYSLGDPEYMRFTAAHYRLTESDFFVPFNEFTAMGMADFQSSPSIRMLYTQGAGFAHFLMHFEGGRYRDKLVQHLSELYRPDVRNVLKEPSLEETLGVSFAELDKQYKEYIVSLYDKRVEPAVR